jgi:putative membrane protein
MRRVWVRTGTCAIALALSAAATYAQSAGGQGEESKVGSRSQAGQRSDTRSKQFVEKMLSANMAEIQLGQIGVQQATSADVKSFAQMMVTDHTQANQELMPLAQQLGVQAPAALDAKHKAIADKLAKLHGAEFDRQYMKAMVTAHQQVLKETKPIAGAGGSMTGSSGGSSAVGTSGTIGSSGAAGTTGTAGATTGAGGSSSGSGSGSSTPSGSGAGSGSSTGSATGTSSSGTSATGAAGVSASSPASVTEYAAKTLPIVQQHLQHAQMLEKTVAK